MQGPYAYEARFYRFEDLCDTFLHGILNGLRPSRDAINVLELTAQLIDRMRDHSMPKMLCLLCDHEFEYNEPPCEIGLAIPWATRDEPALCNALCPQCADLDPNQKEAGILTVWRKLAPDAHKIEIGEA
jgi:hypothetical protein